MTDRLRVATVLGIFACACLALSQALALVAAIMRAVQ
jgi:hypothetical protein